MKLTKGDKILIVILVIFSIFLAFYMARVNKETENKYVSIQIDGEEINTIEFSNDLIGERYTIETEFGYNILEFGDNEVKVVEASCLDKLCIKQGNISQVGQLLVCLPNRLVVEIKTNDSANQNIDDLAF